LLDAVLAANARTVVVLSNGGVVALPFADRVPAIVEGWLLGQAGGGATADVLYGVVNPSGKLTETIPLRLEDNPSYGNFPGEFGHVRYGEGLLVGYRWYDAKDLEVAFPFGHGLSYTTFAYGEASAVATADGDIEVAVAVTNTGPVAGREIVQVYTSLPVSSVQRPPRELKAFASVALDAGETREVVVTVRRKDLAYWDIRTGGWVVEGGAYSFEVGASSRDVRATTTVEIDGDPIRMPLTLDSSVGEVLAHPVGPFVRQAMESMVGGGQLDEGLVKMMESFPLGRLARFPGVGVTSEMVEGLIAMGNAS
jgi:beta-glucosidase